MPDWTRTGTVEGYAQYLCKQAGALAVIVVRVDDAAVAADERLPAEDLRTLFDTRLDGLIANLKAARAERRKGKENVARVTWEEIEKGS